MGTESSVVAHTRGRGIWPSFTRRWPTAAGFTGVLALAAASIVSLTVFGSADPLSIAGMLGLWFVGAAAFGGTAVAIQHAFRQPRVVAPLFAAGMMLIALGIVCALVSLIDPTAEILYPLAVIAPFVLGGIFVLTLVAVLIPSRLRGRMAVAVIGLSAAITAVNVLA